MTPEEALERLVGWATNDASGYGEKAQKQVNEAEAFLRRALLLYCTFCFVEDKPLMVVCKDCFKKLGRIGGE